MSHSVSFTGRAWRAALLALIVMVPLAAADAEARMNQINSGDLDVIRSRVLAGEQPWKGKWDAMLAWRGIGAGRDGRVPSSLSFVPRPVATINVGYYENPNFGVYEAMTDASAAFMHAMQYHVNGDARHARKAIEILDAWGRTLTVITGDNKELNGAMCCAMFCEAAELVRWSYAAPAGSWTNFDRMLRDRFWPLLRNFRPTFNGNWDAVITQAVMGIGVVLDDRAIYNHGRDYFLHGSGKGSLPNYIRADGTTQETSRDQRHEQMGIHALAACAEIAWKQGEDLYATLGDRIMVGHEGTAGRVIQQGEIRYPMWEYAYNHYVNRRGKAMPKTRQVIEQMGYTVDWSPNTAALWPILTHRRLGDNDQRTGPVNTPPAVVLTSPGVGAQFASGAPIRLIATASDTDGIDRVEFFSGATLITIERMAPYDWTWTTAAPGDHAITARAYDSRGASAVTTAVTVRVGVTNTPPQVALTSPIGGTRAPAGSPIRLTATASDADGIERVEYWVGGTLLSTQRVAPYAATWSTAAPGVHALVARAYDNRGAMSASAPTNITVVARGPVTIGGDDAFVRDGSYAEVNFGADQSLMVKRDLSPSWSRETYLRFALPDNLETSDTARLELSVVAVGTDLSTTDLAIELIADAGDGWTESGIRWSNRPTVVVGTPVVVRPMVSVGGTLVIDVSGFVRETLAADSQRRLTLRIRSVQAGVQRTVTFASGEHPTSAAPRLVVTPTVGAG